MNSYAFAIIKATHTAPHKGLPRVIPATDYSDWDLAKEKFARKGRYETKPTEEPPPPPWPWITDPQARKERE